MKSLLLAGAMMPILSPRRRDAGLIDARSVKEFPFADQLRRPTQEDLSRPEPAFSRKAAIGWSATARPANARSSRAIPSSTRRSAETSGSEPDLTNRSTTPSWPVRPSPVAPRFKSRPQTRRMTRKNPIRAVFSSRFASGKRVDPKGFSARRCCRGPYRRGPRPRRTVPVPLQAAR